MGWLVKIGLGFAVPYIIPAVITMLVGGGLGANWYFEWLQVSDVVLLCGFGFFLYLYATSAYEWTKLGCVAAMVACGYIGGRFHENELQQPRIEAARLEVHAEYKGKRDEEVARLEKVNTDLRNKAAAVGVTHMAVRAKLRKERDDAIEAAKKLPGADDVFYTPDDIDVLNSLRHDRKRR